MVFLDSLREIMLLPKRDLKGNTDKLKNDIIVHTKCVSLNASLVANIPMGKHDQLLDLYLITIPAQKNSGKSKLLKSASLN